jgi:hypothetical protein
VDNKTRSTPNPAPLTLKKHDRAKEVRAKRISRLRAQLKRAELKLSPALFFKF